MTDANELHEWERAVERVRVGGHLPLHFRVALDHDRTISIHSVAEVPDREHGGTVTIRAVKFVPSYRWPLSLRERLEFLLACAAELYIHELAEQFAVDEEDNTPRFEGKPDIRGWRPSERPFDPHRDRNAHHDVVRVVTRYL